MKNVNDEDEIQINKEEDPKKDAPKDKKLEKEQPPSKKDETKL